MASLTLRSVLVSTFDSDGSTIPKYDGPCDLAVFNQMLGVSVQILTGKIGVLLERSLCWIRNTHFYY